MQNIASILKPEITRIARKEIRVEVGGLRKSVTNHRSEIAALKRRAQSLEQQVKRLEKAMPTPKANVPISDDAPRFSAKGLAKQRQRLELSAEAVGLLVGASGQSVYNWETGDVTPRADYLAAIAALRILSKQQAAGSRQQRSWRLGRLRSTLPAPPLRGRTSVSHTASITVQCVGTPDLPTRGLDGREVGPREPARPSSAAPEFGRERSPYQPPHEFGVADRGC